MDWDKILVIVQQTIELHRLLAQGKGDSLEAEAIRDAADGPWQTMSESERNWLRNFAESLYQLEGSG